MIFDINKILGNAKSRLNGTIAGFINGPSQYDAVRNWVEALPKRLAEMSSWDGDTLVNMWLDDTASPLGVLIGVTHVPPIWELSDIYNVSPHKNNIENYFVAVINGINRVCSNHDTGWLIAWNSGKPYMYEDVPPISGSYDAVLVDDYDDDYAVEAGD